MNTDRKRGSYSRKSKRVILVSYEGKNKTEKIYFNNFCSRESDFIIQIVPGNETDPVSLVKQTIKKINDLGLDLIEDDRAFCIFDTDTNPQKNEQISAAVELAEAYDIKIITSCPCIELWFLLHYEYTTAIMDNVGVIKRLSKHYNNYDKNCNIYPEIKEKTSVAISNAKKLEKFQIVNGKRINTVEANPHTEIYKIIEELDL